jgi:hypothetical protein
MVITRPPWRPGRCPHSPCGHADGGPVNCLKIIIKVSGSH